MKRVEVDEINPILIIFAAAVATSFILLSCFELRTINGSSMSPTLVEGRRIVVFRLAYGYQLPITKRGPIFSWGGIARNEIIIFTDPDSGIDLVKRCVAIEGDRVGFTENGRLVVSDASEASIDANYTRVGKGFIFVTGDDPETSVDSRHYGPIPVQTVRGRVVFLKSGDLY